MAKQVITRSTSVGANATATPLQGTRFENIYRTGLLTLAAKADSGNNGDVSAEMFVADRNAMELSDLLQAAGALLVPDHVIVDDVEAFVGEKVQLVFRNTTAGAIVVTWRLVLDDNVIATR